MTYIQEYKQTGNQNEYSMVYHWVEDSLTDEQIAIEVAKYPKPK